MKIEEKVKPVILFVYNVNGSIIDNFSDSIHKIVSLDTYPCRLCLLTWDNLGMKKDWRTFINSLEADIEFLHRGEFMKRYQIDVNLPAAFVKRNSSLSLFISSDEINACGTLDDLMNLVRKKVAKVITV